MIRWGDYVPDPAPEPPGRGRPVTATPDQVSLARELARRLARDGRALTDEERDLALCADLALGALARLRPIDPVDLDLLLRCIRPDLTFGARYGAWHGVCAVIDAQAVE